MIDLISDERLKEIAAATPVYGWQKERLELVKEIIASRAVLALVANTDNWNTFVMWPGPAAKVIMQWLGDPGIRKMAQKALASGGSTSSPTEVIKDEVKG